MESLKKDFLTRDVTVGRLNALVKRIGGLDIMAGILNGTVEFSITKNATKVAREFLGPADEVVLPGHAG